MATSRILVDMSATLIHHGHVRLLSSAAKHGQVIVGLCTDEEIVTHKGYRPELSFEQRREIMLSIRHVQEVLPAPWLITDDYLDLYSIDYLIHGHDNQNNVSSDRLIILQRTEGISSTLLRARVLQATAQKILSSS